MSRYGMHNAEGRSLAKMVFEEFPDAHESLLPLLNDVCEVSDVFRAKIRFPESACKHVYDNINLLLTLAREGSAGAEVTGISCTLTKSAEHARTFLVVGNNFHQADLWPAGPSGSGQFRRATGITGSKTCDGCCVS